MENFEIGSEVIKSVTNQKICDVQLQSLDLTLTQCMFRPFSFILTVHVIEETPDIYIYIYATNLVEEINGKQKQNVPSFGVRNFLHKN